MVGLFKQQLKTLLVIITLCLFAGFALNWLLTVEIWGLLSNKEKFSATTFVVINIKRYEIEYTQTFHEVKNGIHINIPWCTKGYTHKSSMRYKNLIHVITFIFIEEIRHTRPRGIGYIGIGEVNLPFLLIMLIGYCDFWGKTYGILNVIYGTFSRSNELKGLHSLDIEYWLHSSPNPKRGRPHIIKTLKEIWISFYLFTTINDSTAALFLTSLPGTCMYVIY